MGQHGEHPQWDERSSLQTGAFPAALLLLWGAALWGASCAFENYLHFGSHFEFCLLPHSEEGNGDLVLAQDPDPHMLIQGDEDGSQWDVWS